MSFVVVNPKKENVSRYEKDRIERALNQRMYLLKNEHDTFFRVAGTTRDYNVILKQHIIDLTGDDEKKDEEKKEAPNDLKMSARCTCPDFTSRHRTCKHIYFVLYRVLYRISDRLLKKLNYGDFEEPTRKKKAKKTRLEVEDTYCCICYEDFEKGEIDKLIEIDPEQSNTTSDLDYCEHCNHVFHTSCLNIWINRSNHKNCPLCRKSLK